MVKVIFFAVVGSYLMLCVKPKKKNRKRKFSDLELFMSALYSDYCTIALHPGESLVPAFVELSIDRLFDNLESGKSPGNVLNFASRNLYEPWL